MIVQWVSALTGVGVMTPPCPRPPTGATPGPVRRPPSGREVSAPAARPSGCRPARRTGAMPRRSPAGARLPGWTSAPASAAVGRTSWGGARRSSPPPSSRAAPASDCRARRSHRSGWTRGPSPCRPGRCWRPIPGHEDDGADPAGDGDVDHLMGAHGLLEIELDRARAGAEGEERRDGPDPSLHVARHPAGHPQPVVRVGADPADVERRGTAQPGRYRRDGQIRHERVEVGEGPRLESGADPLGELLRSEPALLGGRPQDGDRGLAFLVSHPQVCRIRYPSSVIGPGTQTVVSTG